MRLIWLVSLAATCTCSVDLEQPLTLCERTLAEAHFMFCYSAEYGAYAQEDVSLSVSPLFDMLSSTAEPKPARSPQFDQVLLKLTPQSQRLGSERPPRTKRSGGIVEECCLKPCYISQLLNYC